MKKKTTKHHPSLGRGTAVASEVNEQSCNYCCERMPLLVTDDCLGINSLVTHYPLSWRYN